MPSSCHTSQDALDGAAVELFKDLGTHAKSFQSPEGEKVLSCFTTVLVGLDHDSWFVMWTPRNFTLDQLHYSPVDVNGGLFGPPFPVVNDQLFCLDHVEGRGCCPGTTLPGL